MGTSTNQTAMARAFRETTLGLIGLYQVFDVDPAMSVATAEVLGELFWRHLDGSPPVVRIRTTNPMHALADELDHLAWGKVSAGGPASGPGG